MPSSRSSSKVALFTSSGPPRRGFAGFAFEVVLAALAFAVARARFFAPVAALPADDFEVRLACASFLAVAAFFLRSSGALARASFLAAASFSRASLFSAPLLLLGGLFLTLCLLLRGLFLARSLLLGLLLHLGGLLGFGLLRRRPLGLL